MTSKMKPLAKCATTDLASNASQIRPVPDVQVSHAVRLPPHVWLSRAQSDLGFTDADMALGLGVSTRTYQRYKSGTTDVPWKFRDSVCALLRKRNLDTPSERLKVAKAV